MSSLVRQAEDARVKVRVAPRDPRGERRLGARAAPLFTAGCQVRRGGDSARRRRASPSPSKGWLAMCRLKRAEAKPALTETIFCTRLPAMPPARGVLGSSQGGGDERASHLDYLGASRPLKGSEGDSAVEGGKRREISSDSVYAVTAPKRSSRSVAVATIASWMRRSYGRRKPFVYVWKQWPSSRTTHGRCKSTIDEHASSSYLARRTHARARLGVRSARGSRTKAMRCAVAHRFISSPIVIASCARCLFAAEPVAMRAACTRQAGRATGRRIVAYAELCDQRRAMVRLDELVFPRLGSNFLEFFFTRRRANVPRPPVPTMSVKYVLIPAADDSAITELELAIPPTLEVRRAERSSLAFVSPPQVALSSLP